MSGSSITPTTLPGVFVVAYPVFEDARGFFHECFRRSELEAATGHALTFAQWNHSQSMGGVLRGIHVAPYRKLVYVTSGSVLNVVVDLRPESPTFLRHEKFWLVPEQQPRCLYLPPGFGNGYYVESNRADYLYLVTEEYAPGRELTVRWDDPDLGIAWPDTSPRISERDKAANTVRELFPAMFAV